MLARMPVLFISHGAPTFAINPGHAGAALAVIGQNLRHVQAVVIVSAHWTTSTDVQVTGASAPATIHDFFGFPERLYALRYPAPGYPQLAQRLVKRLCAGGWQAQLDADRGLDHGAWVPLLHLLPQAQTPVVQVSLPLGGGAEHVWRLGQALASWRDAGVLIVGSGTLTHNLRDLQAPGAPVAPYVQAFIDWVRARVVALDYAALCDYRARAPGAVRAHPSEEHFLPLLFAVGATHADDPVRVIDGGVENGALALDAYVFGRLAE